MQTPKPTYTSTTIHSVHRAPDGRISRLIRHRIRKMDDVRLFMLRPLPAAWEVLYPPKLAGALKTANVEPLPENPIP